MHARTTKDIPPPEGLLYQAEVLRTEEQQLIAHIQELALAEFELPGYLAKRRVYSFGWHHDFEQVKLRPADEIPPFLQRTRVAASFAGLGS